MFYYLFQYLDKINFPGAGVFQYISFRAAMAVLVSLLISMIFGKKIIGILLDTGGIADKIQEIIHLAKRGSGNVVYETDPELLVKKLIDRIDRAKEENGL